MWFNNSNRSVFYIPNKPVRIVIYDPLSGHILIRVKICRQLLYGRYVDQLTRVVVTFMPLPYSLSSYFPITFTLRLSCPQHHILILHQALYLWTDFVSSRSWQIWSNMHMTFHLQIHVFDEQCISKQRETHDRQTFYSTL